MAIEAKRTVLVPKPSCETTPLIAELKEALRKRISPHIEVHEGVHAPESGSPVQFLCFSPRGSVPKAIKINRNAGGSACPCCDPRGGAGNINSPIYTTQDGVQIFIEYPVIFYRQDAGHALLAINDAALPKKKDGKLFWIMDNYTPMNQEVNAAINDVALRYGGITITHSA